MPVCGVQIVPLTGSIGAEVVGLDVNQSIAPATFAAIRQAFLDHSVLVFRGQFLAPDAQRRFGRFWGPLLATPDYPIVEGYPEVIRVEDYGKRNTPTENWHSDWSWRPDPPSISIAAAQILPEVGGDTLFADQYRAYESLSVGLKRLIEGLKLKHAGRRVLAGMKFESVASFHRVVKTHPETNRKALWIGIGRFVATHFEDMTEAESRPLLETLLERAVAPDLIYRHRWRPGDVVIWDNRCTLHYGVHDYVEGSGRLLHRVTVAGTE